MKRILGILAAFSLIMAACGSDDDEVNAEPAVTQPDDAAPDDAAPDDPEPDDAAPDDPEPVNTEPLKIGVLAVLSGPFGSIGAAMVEGIELVLEQHGPVQGRELEVIVEDSKLDAAETLTKATKLVEQDNVDIIVGVSGSNEALALAGQADRLGVPIVTTNAQAEAITGEECHELIFRTTLNDGMVRGANELFVDSSPDILERDWFILGHDYVFGHDAGDAFAATPGVNIVDSTYAPLDTADWASYLTQIEQSGATGVWLALATGTPLLQVLQQADSFGLLENIMFVPPFGLPDQFIDELGETSVGLQSGSVLYGWTVDQIVDGLDDIHAAWFDKYGTAPQFQAMNSYFGVDVVLQGLDAAESLDTAGIVASLEGLTASTPFGDQSFAANHQLKRPVYFGEVGPAPANPYGTEFAFIVEGLVDPDALVDPTLEACNR